ncbi:hypothetical protein TREMEDRAFT_63643 [Tremella mesenterica DSM 1558]|uniref:uncharacterized protein n=1 Tax=Tremella mesenterica (strain ATCC 24925 / CBS 8224 / DSM 1558 / NBRC 9311 / NRRL Y-6157 / RJB 2259-6 / UBC 559-6) TaxID=578456 RepID=UPI0003F4A32B|nr:uncharacterized protein TREMEDRAFT_63643 [Tremella mesenterica DSM 1558]EIW68475.1 hypothetical protein TREMEDRAFT_63643 [Tremella mesenterica DSM 1558]
MPLINVIVDSFCSPLDIKATVFVTNLTASFKQVASEYLAIKKQDAWEHSEFKWEAYKTKLDKHLELMAECVYYYDQKFRTSTAWRPPSKDLQSAITQCASVKYHWEQSDHKAFSTWDPNQRPPAACLTDWKLKVEVNRDAKNVWLESYKAWKLSPTLLSFEQEERLSSTDKDQLCRQYLESYKNWEDIDWRQRYTSYPSWLEWMTKNPQDSLASIHLADLTALEDEMRQISEDFQKFPAVELLKGKIEELHNVSCTLEQHAEDWEEKRTEFLRQRWANTGEDNGALWEELVEERKELISLKSNLRWGFGTEDNGITDYSLYSWCCEHAASYAEVAKTVEVVRAAYNKVSSLPNMPQKKTPETFSQLTSGQSLIHKR